MEYIVLIYGDEKAWNRMPKSQIEQVYAAYRKYTEELQKAGVMKGGSELKPTTTATTVRVRNGKRQVTDGPFSETKEQLGGYYLVNARDLDEALTIAAKIPGARYGSIEVRPIMVFNQ